MLRLLLVLLLQLQIERCGRGFYRTAPPKRCEHLPRRGSCCSCAELLYLNCFLFCRVEPLLLQHLLLLLLLAMVVLQVCVVVHSSQEQSLQLRQYLLLQDKQLLLMHLLLEGFLPQLGYVLTVGSLCQPLAVAVVPRPSTAVCSQ